MKKSFNRIIALLLAMIVILSLAGCGSSRATGAPNSAESSQKEQTASSAKDSLVIALPGEPQSLDPYAHSMYYNFMAATLIYDTLFTKDADGNIAPELATSWKFTDDLTLHVILRDDVTFHDGNKLTAEDVKFSFATAAASSFSSSIFAWYDPDNTTVIDDTTIDIKLKYAYAPVLEVLSSIRSGIVEKAVYEANPDSYAQSPIGSGPMKVDGWYSGDRIELVANDNYWGEPLAYKTCTLRIIVESSSRTIELETGGVDIVVDLPFADWTRVDEAEGIELVSGRTNNMASLVFNNSNKLFSDIRVRQALAYALDLKSLVKICWEGTAEVADSYYTSSMLGYKQEGPQEYNIEKAKELLAQAGYPDGFEFTYTTYQTTLNQAFAEVLQSMWAQIGVTVKIDIVDLATFTDMNNAGKLTAALMTPNVAISDPAAALILWPITRTISLRHNDQHIQDLLDAGSSTYNEEERIKTYQELQDYLASQTYTVPIAFPTFAYGVASNVDGFVFQPSQIPDLTTVSFR
ncbi:Heme-binding protein A [bioreactor metagenome]|uniref:Heme-binding protein A n=1 Tax=bioreactor metagenome TaxID=1076179 RepID=A0A644XMA7_9ZZZZ